MCGRDWMPVGFLLIAVVLGACSGGTEATPSAASTPAPVEVAKAPDQRPPGGDAKVGNASIYSNSLQGKPMADGKPYDPAAPVAASKTLPLGTVAKVTNLENGKSTEVKVEDRGPMVKGRVVDLAPAAASKLGLTQKKGIARVEVKPVAPPGSKQEAAAGP
jgi:rare lipoprotein A